MILVGVATFGRPEANRKKIGRFRFYRCSRPRCDRCFTEEHGHFDFDDPMDGTRPARAVNGLASPVTKGGET